MSPKPNFFAFQQNSSKVTDFFSTKKFRSAATGEKNSGPLILFETDRKTKQNDFRRFSPVAKIVTQYFRNQIQFLTWVKVASLVCDIFFHMRQVLSQLVPSGKCKFVGILLSKTFLSSHYGQIWSHKFLGHHLASFLKKFFAPLNIA